MNFDQPEKTNSERAYRMLREEIVAGELPAGLKLKIEMLRQRYDLGAGPLREALARLSSNHLVVLEGQRGFAVAPMSIEDANDIGALRKMLEVEALRMSFARGDDDWEAGVVATFHALERNEQRSENSAEPDFTEWERRNGLFHGALVVACDSSWLLRIRNQMFEQHERYRRLSRVTSLGSRDVRKEHKQLLETAISRDIDSAVAVINRHIQRTTDIVAEALSRMEVIPEKRQP